MRTSKSTFLTRLRSAWVKRNEAGAGGLLPIITIGMMVVVVAASVATATTFAAKISGQQVSQMSKDMEIGSLLNIFIIGTQSGTPLAPSATVPGTGSYAVYYSTAEAQPTSRTAPGTLTLPASGIPTTAKWILLELTPETGSEQTAVFSVTPKGSQTLDNLINWSGAAAISESTLTAASGSRGPVTVAIQESTVSSGQKLTIADSTISADVFATYDTEQMELKGGTLRGNLSSKFRIQYDQNPRVYGDVSSGSLINGTAKVSGAQRANDGARPLNPPQTANQLSLTGARTTLTAADCNTPAKLKAKLESFAVPTAVDGAELCAPASWKAEIKPKSDVLIHTADPLSVENLTVAGPAGSLGFAAEDALQLKSVKYTDGARGQFLSADSLTVIDSDLNGAISSYGAAGGVLTLTNSTVRYTPVSAPLVGACGTATCALSSNSVHLLRVS